MAQVPRINFYMLLFDFTFEEQAWSIVESLFKTSLINMNYKLAQFHVIMMSLLIVTPSHSKSTLFAHTDINDDHRGTNKS